MLRLGDGDAGSRESDSPAFIAVAVKDHAHEHRALHTAQWAKEPLGDEHQRAAAASYTCCAAASYRSNQGLRVLLTGLRCASVKFGYLSLAQSRHQSYKSLPSSARACRSMIGDFITMTQQGWLHLSHRPVLMMNPLAVYRVWTDDRAGTCSAIRRRLGAEGHPARPSVVQLPTRWPGLDLGTHETFTGRDHRVARSGAASHVLGVNPHWAR